MLYEPIDTNDPLTALMLSRGEEPDEPQYLMAQGCSRRATSEPERYVAQDTLGACEMDLKYQRIERH